MIWRKLDTVDKILYNTMKLNFLKYVLLKPTGQANPNSSKKQWGGAFKEEWIILLLLSKKSARVIFLS